MHNQTLITVRDVEASAEWYKKNLGLAKGHGGSHYEQLIYDGKLILQLHSMKSMMFCWKKENFREKGF